MKRRQSATPEPDTQARVEINTEVLRRIRQHARSSMSAEICGVLVGSLRNQTTVVEDSIEGEQARQGGSHVTFTQDTWTHIYQVKDNKYPDKRIVGWYHSHPGFGVFLSEHDTFIHRNFFSSQNQVAWVYDPHSDEEGCFVWEKDAIVRLPQFSMRDAPMADMKCRRVKETQPGDSVEEWIQEDKASRRRPVKRIMLWTGLTLSHVFLLILGFLIGVLFFPQVIVIPDRGSAVDRPAAPQADQRK